MTRFIKVALCACVLSIAAASAPAARAALLVPGETIEIPNINPADPFTYESHDTTGALIQSFFPGINGSLTSEAIVGNTFNPLGGVTLAYTINGASFGNPPRPATISISGFGNAELDAAEFYALGEGVFSTQIWLVDAARSPDGDTVTFIPHAESQPHPVEANGSGGQTAIILIHTDGNTFETAQGIVEGDPQFTIETFVAKRALPDAGATSILFTVALVPLMLLKPSHRVPKIDPLVARESVPAASFPATGVRYPGTEPPIPA